MVDFKALKREFLIASGRYTERWFLGDDRGQVYVSGNLVPVHRRNSQGNIVEVRHVRGSVEGGIPMDRWGIAVRIGYDHENQWAIKRIDWSAALAQGHPPALANAADPNVMRQIISADIINLKATVTNPPTTDIAVHGYYYVRGRVYQGLSRELVPLVGYIPSSNEQRVVGVALNTQTNTVEAFASTVKSLADVLDMTDVQEVINGFSPGSIPIWAFRLHDAQTVITQNDVMMDLRPLWMPDPRDLLSFADSSTLTISSGSATTDRTYHVLQAETGTADSLTTLVAVEDNQFVVLQAAPGHTITLEHETDNLTFFGQTNIVLSGNKALALFYDGSYWSDIAVGGGVGGYGYYGNYVMATPNGSGGAATLRPLVDADIPNVLTLTDLSNAQHDHTDAAGGGTLVASAISDFDTEVANNADVAANTIHRGVVTGNPHAVTKGDVGLGNVPNVDITDAQYIVATADSDLTAEQNLGLLSSGVLVHDVAAGVSTIASKTNPMGAFVGTTDVQTLSDKSFLGQVSIIGDADEKQLIIKASATQSNANPLFQLQTSAGAELSRWHSDDSTNVFVGASAGAVNNASGGGLYNSAFGCLALHFNTIGLQNSAFGYTALYTNTTGLYNSAFGFSALRVNATGLYNSAFGHSALYTNATGAGNSAFGYEALRFNTTGAGNSAFGVQALYNLLPTSKAITAFADAGAGQVTVTSVGHGRSNGNSVVISGTTNYNGTFTIANVTADTFEITDTWVSDDATGWWQLTGEGNNNVALGYQAGFSGVKSTGNVLIGHKAGYYHTGNNALYIANSDTASPLIYGEFDTPLVRVNGALDVTGALTSATIDGDDNMVQDLNAGTVFKAATYVGTANGGSGADNSGAAEGDILISDGTNFIAATNQLGLRNRVIDGRLDFWPEGSSFTNPANGDYLSALISATRVDDGGSFSSTVSRQSFAAGQTDVAGQPRYFLRATGGITGGSGSELWALTHAIEDVRTFNGETVTLILAAKGSAAGTIAANLFQNFGSGGSATVYIAGQELSLTTSWQLFALTFSVSSISGKTIGSGDDHYLGIRLYKQAGATRATAVNLSGAINFTGDLDMVMLQLVPGSITTPFEFRGDALERSLVSRYYQKSYDPSASPGGITTVGGVTFSTRLAVAASTSGVLLPTLRFNSTMRIAPTMTIYSTGTGASGAVRNATAANDRTGVTADGIGLNGVFRLVVSNASANAIALDDQIRFQWVADARF